MSKQAKNEAWREVALEQTARKAVKKLAEGLYWIDYSLGGAVVKSVISGPGMPGDIEVKRNDHGMLELTAEGFKLPSVLQSGFTGDRALIQSLVTYAKQHWNSQGTSSGEYASPTLKPEDDRIKSERTYAYRGKDVTEVYYRCGGFRLLCDGRNFFSSNLDPMIHEIVAGERSASFTSVKEALVSCAG